MNLNQVNQVVNNFNANVAVEAPKSFMDFYKMVKEEKIVPVTDKDGTIIGFNTVANKPTTLKVCKMIDGHMTAGDTEEQRNEDELKLKEFLTAFEGQNLQEWFEKAYLISKMRVNIDDIIIDTSEDYDRDYYYLIDGENKRVLDMRGNTVIDLSDDEDLKGASKNLVVKMLKATFNSNF